MLLRSLFFCDQDSKSTDSIVRWFPACLPALCPSFLKKILTIIDQAAQQFANQFYDALLSMDSLYTVKQAYDIALNTVNADNPNAPPQGDHFLLLPAGVCCYPPLPSPWEEHSKNFPRTFHW